MKMVKKEPLEKMTMVEPLFAVKGEPMPDAEDSLTSFASPQPLIVIKGETCPREEECTDIEAHQNEQLYGNISSMSCSGDNMPSDWFCDASSDSEEVPVTATDDSVSNNPIKEEPLPDDKEPVTIFASTQPASPSIAIKGETCLCPGDNCLDCLEALQTDQTDTEETIIDSPVNVSAAPVSNSFATTFTRSHACPKCGKIFVKTSNFQTHQRVRTGERPFTCAVCPKAFNQLGNLKRHQLIHQAVRRRPFLCTTKECGKAFTTKSNLTVHSQTHTGERPYKCESCGKSYVTSGGLTVHHRAHTGERPYKCHLCPKAFSQWSHAKKHQQNVHSGSP